MIKHEKIIHIPAKEFNRINKLLAVESLEELTDEELHQLNANTNVREGLYDIEFDNGATMSIDLCSGQHNYWDDVVWKSPDRNKYIVLDCSYKLDDIEVEINSELYSVKFVKTFDKMNKFLSIIENKMAKASCDVLRYTELYKNLERANNCRGITVYRYKKNSATMAKYLEFIKKRQSELITYKNVLYIANNILNSDRYDISE